MADVQQQRRNSLTSADASRATLQRCSSERLHNGRSSVSSLDGDHPTGVRRCSSTRRISRVTLYPGEVLSATLPGALSGFQYFLFSSKEGRSNHYAACVVGGTYACTFS